MAPQRVLVASRVPTNLDSATDNVEGSRERGIASRKRTNPSKVPPSEKIVLDAKKGARILPSGGERGKHRGRSKIGFSTENGVNGNEEGARPYPRGAQARGWGAERELEGRGADLAAIWKTRRGKDGRRQAQREGRNQVSSSFSR